jgi:hypothetical protein
MGVMLGGVRCLTADATKNPYGLSGWTAGREAEPASGPGRDW